MSVTRKGRLKGLPAKVENAVKEGLILGGDLVAQRARRRAHVVSGRLKRSITRGNPKRTTTGMYIEIGTNVEYAEIEEFREGEKHGTPHSYLRPALRESREDVLRLIIKRVGAALLRL